MADNPTNEKRQLFIKTLCAGTVILNVTANDTVQRLKQQIESATNVPTESQKLLFKGKLLKDDIKSLREYKVENKCMLHLLTKPKINSPATMNKIPTTTKTTKTTKPKPSSIKIKSTAAEKPTMTTKEDIDDKKTDEPKAKNESNDENKTTVNKLNTDKKNVNDDDTDKKSMNDGQKSPSSSVPVPASPTSPSTESKNDDVKEWHSGFQILWTTKAVRKRDKNEILKEQNNECAACRNKLKTNFLTKLKAHYFYCEYTGYFYCNKCHKNDKIIIPYRVLNKLECEASTVCVAVKRYLSQMYDVPCITFNLFGHEAEIQKNEKIVKLKKLLFEFEHIKKYLDLCAAQNDVISEIEDEYKHWIIFAGSLSLHDCVDIISSDLSEKIQKISNKLKRHVISQCDQCKLKAQICAICNDENDKIYSFQYNQVKQCDKCNNCYHTKCWTGKCKNSSCQNTK